MNLLVGIVLCAAWFAVCAWLAYRASRSYGLHPGIMNDIAACYWVAGSGLIALAIIFAKG
jgi:hypothetical protein